MCLQLHLIQTIFNMLMCTTFVSVGKDKVHCAAPACDLEQLLQRPTEHTKQNIDWSENSEDNNKIQLSNVWVHLSLTVS